MKIDLLIKAFLQDKDAMPYPVWESVFADPKSLPFSAEVRGACEKNYCGCYGTCWNCPPAVGEWEALRDHFHAYQSVFIFTTRHELEDPFDIEGMDEGRVKHEKLARYLCQYLAERGNSTPGSFEVLGAGGCHLCQKCTYPDAPCRHPELVFRAMEACGMDVVALSSALGIHYINGENTVTYFSALFWNEN